MSYVAIDLTINSVLRVATAVLGTGAIAVAAFAKDEFRWGRRGNGPKIEPQWVGRAFFAFIGAVMLYVAVSGFK